MTITKVNHLFHRSALPNPISPSPTKRQTIANDIVISQNEDEQTDATPIPTIENVSVYIRIRPSNKETSQLNVKKNCIENLQKTTNSTLTITREQGC